jgi:hypothetical protein
MIKAGLDFPWSATDFATETILRLPEDATTHFRKLG